MSLNHSRSAWLAQAVPGPKRLDSSLRSSTVSRLGIPLAIGAAAAISLFPSQASAAPTVFNLTGSGSGNTISPVTNISQDNLPYTLTTGSGAFFANIVSQGSVSAADIAQAFANFSPDFTTNNNLFGGNGTTTTFTLITNPVALSGGPIGTLITFTPGSASGTGVGIGTARFSDVSNWSFTTNTGYTGTMDFSFLSQGQGNPSFSWSAQGDINAPDPVPGPLPILGAASAFAMSRRLRKRIKSA